MARGAQTAIDQLERACGQYPTYSAHFSHFADHFAALVRRFNDGPISLAIRNPVTHRMQTVQLTKATFAETVRHALYFASGAAYMPVTIERAYHRDCTPLAQMVSQMALTFASAQAAGLNLSVSCSEDIPFITEADVAPYSAGTLRRRSGTRVGFRRMPCWMERGSRRSSHANAMAFGAIAWSTCRFRRRYRVTLLRKRADRQIVKNRAARVRRFRGLRETLGRRCSYFLLGSSAGLT